MLDCGFWFCLLLLRLGLFLLVDVAGFESIVAVEEEEDDDAFCVFFLLTMNSADDDDDDDDTE